MKTDTEIRLDGIKALVQALGVIEAERFIALVNRERFDYTEWRKTQWQDETVASLAAKARGLRAAHPNEPVGE
ncbi:MAG: hypothetical protein U1F76_14920 [Candidatus Competibacteraceae bacterium]